MKIMVKAQNRNWFGKKFLPGKSAEYSYNEKVPLRKFNKS